MSADRPRPWHDPTPLVDFQPEWIGQFDTFQDWVNHASRALTGFKDSNGYDLNAICVDALGRRCSNGKDMMRARDEAAFPVRYFTTGTVAAVPATSDGADLEAALKLALKAMEDAWLPPVMEGVNGRMTKLGEAIDVARAALRRREDETGSNGGGE